jgi:hypothetical protein
VGESEAWNQPVRPPAGQSYGDKPNELILTALLSVTTMEGRAGPGF